MESRYNMWFREIKEEEVSEYLRKGKEKISGDD